MDSMVDFISLSDDLEERFPSCDIEVIEVLAMKVWYRLPEDVQKRLLEDKDFQLISIEPAPAGLQMSFEPPVRGVDPNLKPWNLSEKSIRNQKKHAALRGKAFGVAFLFPGDRSNSA